MTTLQTTIRRFFALSAFTALIAAVTISFAGVPKTVRSATFAKAKAAVRVTPTKALRLAEAPPGQRKSSATPAQSNASGLSGRLNLNTASAQELMILPGIGPKKAAKIIAWREKHGKFKRIAGLRRVKGFGAKTLKKLRPYLSVSGQTTLE